jgi:urease subunit gamma/beta
VRLTPSERDRLLLFTAAELARTRKNRGLKLNVPEATALIADAVAEAARDGHRLLVAAEVGRSVLSSDDVLPGVTDIVVEVKVEAVFDDGTRLVVVRDPFRALSGLGTEAPGSVTAADAADVGAEELEVVELIVTNRSTVPVSITSHFHFFEVNPRLEFDRKRTYGMRLAIPAGAAQRFEPGEPTYVRLRPIGGDRIAIGFAGLVDGSLDDDAVRAAAFRRATSEGYLGMGS